MVELRLLGAGVGNLAHGVQHGGVVTATEQIADFRQAFLGQLLGGTWRLARQSDIGRPAFRIHVGHLDLVEIRHRLLDVLDGDLAVGHGQQILQGFLADVHGEHVAAMEAGVGQHLAQRAFEFAHVAAQVLGDEERHFLGHRHAFGLGLAQQDRHAHFEFGRLDRDRQAGIEARDQAAVDARQFLRIGIAGDDDLLALRHHRFERIEEFFLRAVLAGEELDIVDQQQVERMVVALEVIERLALVRLDHVGHVLVGMHVAHAHPGARRHHGVADGVDQVGLAQAHAAIQEQRVVRRARVLGHLQRGGARQLVGLTRHEVLERQVGVQARALVHDVGGVRVHGRGRRGGRDGSGRGGCAGMLVAARRPGRGGRRRGLHGRLRAHRRHRHARVVPCVGNSNKTCTGRSNHSAANASIWWEKFLRTQSSLNRLGAATRSTACVSSYASGTSGRIHALICWGVPAQDD